MIALAIDRTSLSLADLAVVDSGDSGVTLVPGGWRPGGAVRDRQYATAPNVDGAALTASRREILTMTAQFRLFASSTDAATTLADALIAALEQDEYEITETLGTRVAVYDCMAADWSWEYEGSEFAAGTLLVSALIPRQP